MKDFDHLMSVWQEQPVHDKLSVEDVLKQVKKDVSGIANKLWWNIMAIVAVLAIALVIMLFLVFNWVTYLGIMIMMVSMLFYFSMMIRHFRILNKHDATISPTDYLISLHEYQKERAKSNRVVLLYLCALYQYRVVIIFV